MKIYKQLPAVEKIKSTRELKVGMEMVYTGDPRGTGMMPPEIGCAYPIENESDIVGFAIEMIERGRGWWPTKESFDRLNTHHNE